MEIARVNTCSMLKIQKENNYNWNKIVITDRERIHQRTLPLKIVEKPIIHKIVVVCVVLKLEVRFVQAKIERSEVRRPEEIVTAMATAL